MYILYKKYLLRKRKVFHNKNQKKTYLINYLYSKVFLKQPSFKEKNLKNIMEINHGFNFMKTFVKQIKNIK